MNCPFCQVEGLQNVIHIMFCEKPRRLELLCHTDCSGDRCKVGHGWQNEDCDKVIKGIWESASFRRLRKMCDRTKMPVMFLRHLRDESIRLNEDRYERIYCRAYGND